MRLRPAVTRLHRWFGLSMAGFLFLAGLSGAFLAWYEELDAWLSPALLKAQPVTGHEHVLAPLVLRAQVERAYPDKLVNHIPLSQPAGRSAVFYVVARPGQPGTPEAPVLQVLVHPYTGQVLGERVLGEIGFDPKHVMPFIYRLHHSLALGTAGIILLGAMAILWTVDCFLGFWLTLPAPRRRLESAVPGQLTGKPWLVKWKHSWSIRWHNGAYKRNFDLHRAGGLWIWPMLVVLAWSSVAFNLSPVYYSTMKSAGLPFQGTAKSLQASGVPQFEPGLDWSQALKTGRELMSAQALARDFKTEREDLLYYDVRKATFSYYVRSSLDVREKVGRTHVVFDAHTGALRSTWIPTGAAAGDTLTSWITALHIAGMWGQPFQIFVTLMGVLVAMLSLTGLVIWQKKRLLRRKADQARRH
ncbi:PepSY-associated TM helix domain-containing protein [Ottowia thiooxydans]|uniref:Iron-regulated membrane protein n=1 Tax=Ottowia thiooxydans TaxID=219182 RepID=A0ABV2QGK5_9BURK